MQIIILRPQALYGPRCISGRVTQKFIERGLSGLPLIINGTGEEIHDFTYIDDLSKAVEFILEKHDFSRKECFTWNITGEAATPLAVLAKLVADRYDVEIAYGPKDEDKPSRGTMSCVKLRKAVGYTPHWAIDRGMKRYMDWYDAHYGDAEEKIEKAQITPVG